MRDVDIFLELYVVTYTYNTVRESETLVQRFKKIFIIILFCLCLWIKKKEIEDHFEQTIYLID
jgi:hypothetical protein